MDRAEKIGGSAAHDQRREGAVTPPEHNLKRSKGTKSPTEQRLEDPIGHMASRPAVSDGARRNAPRIDQGG